MTATSQNNNLRVLTSFLLIDFRHFHQPNGLPPPQLFLSLLLYSCFIFAIISVLFSYCFVQDQIVIGSLRMKNLVMEKSHKNVPNAKNTTAEICYAFRFSFLINFPRLLKHPTLSSPRRTKFGINLGICAVTCKQYILWKSISGTIFSTQGCIVPIKYELIFDGQEGKISTLLISCLQVFTLL